MRLLSLLVYNLFIPNLESSIMRKSYIIEKPHEFQSSKQTPWSSTGSNTSSCSIDRSRKRLGEESNRWQTERVADAMIGVFYFFHFLAQQLGMKKNAKIPFCVREKNSAVTIRKPCINFYGFCTCSSLYSVLLVHFIKNR